MKAEKEQILADHETEKEAIKDIITEAQTSISDQISRET